MNKPLLLSLLCLLGSSACAMIPTLPSAQAPIPATWQEVKSIDAAPPDGANSTAQQPWRQFYRHALWQEVIDTALTNNRDLQAAVARMAKAKALLGISAAQRLPSLQANLQHQETRTPADLSQTGNHTVIAREDLQVALPAFELDFWGRVNALHEAAKATYLANAESVQAVRILLIAQVVESLVTWRELAEKTALSQQRLAVQKELLELLGERKQVGITSAQSHWQAVLAWEEAKAALADLQRQEGVARHALQLLTGHNWDPDRHWPLLEELLLSDVVPSGMPASALALRPDVRAAEFRLRAANADIGAARAAFWPRIHLTSSVGLASAGLQGLFQSGATAWSFLPAIELPIFDAGQRRLTQEAAEAEQTALLAEYEKVIQQAFREVADGLSARKALTEHLQALKNSHQAQLARQQLLHDRWQVGVDSKQEFLQQQLALYGSEQQLRSLERHILVNQAGLYKALGGGTEKADEEQSTSP
ncbi:MAG: efflux transporter outer membrane subunit [Magnetococcales bacterium]|nr:efflux transporter outer membrane subunit [Magnetococcales bacterium]MBF0115375.1 efflux transporter outer membrane subunit [Magnetococcales bacterium]